MRLDFRLLVIDDVPTSVNSAVGTLDDHLGERGFRLVRRDAEDLSASGLRELAKNEGRDYDLVMIDYNLGREDTDGARAAASMRRQLPYTDIIFYSTDPSADLHAKLAQERVDGIFLAGRLDIDDVLKGVANTIIGKAVDLSHMRGIAMAEVADMDVMMEKMLERVFDGNDSLFNAAAARTKEKLVATAKEGLAKTEEMVAKVALVDIVGDGRQFPSAVKYMTVRRVANCLSKKPDAALAILDDYDKEIIFGRNTLAHAKEDVGEDGSVTLRSIRRGQPPVVITDEWMTAFRKSLRKHGAALQEVCLALERHLTGQTP